MLVTSIFSFSHSIFKRLIPQGRQKSGLFGKELIYCMVFNAVFSIISVTSQRPVHLSIHSWSYFHQYSVFFLSHWLLSHITTYRNNSYVVRERNESCCNNYLQSSERILTEPLFEPATSCSQVSYSTNCPTGARSSVMHYTNEDITYSLSHKNASNQTTL